MQIIVKTPNIVAVTELPKSNKFFRFSIIYIENDSSEVTKQLKVTKSPSFIMNNY